MGLLKDANSIFITLPLFLLRIKELQSGLKSSKFENPS
jgi:hypothetical protein